MIRLTDPLKRLWRTALHYIGQVPGVGVVKGRWGRVLLHVVAWAAVFIMFWIARSL